VGRRLIGTVAVLMLGGALAAAASARVSAPDRTPPGFAGLASATTCIPGPIGGQSAAYRLTWDAATDNRTPSTQIVYEIYQATKSGGEDFSSPTYSSQRCATTFTTPPLRSDTTFYFVVRARDRAGNRDSNTVEREGVNICV
jgi:hypothetical protein